MKEPNISIYFFFLPITQWYSISDVRFTGGKGVSDFSVLKYYYLNINSSGNKLSKCLHILIDCSQLSKIYYNVLFGSSTRDRHARRIYRRTKVTHKASDVPENLQLYRVVRFFRPRSSCTTHISADVQRRTLNASCMTISGGRTEQLDIIAGFLPRHWLYEWFSQFHSCGTYSILSRSPSIKSHH